MCRLIETTSKTGPGAEDCASKEVAPVIAIANAVTRILMSHFLVRLKPDTAPFDDALRRAAGELARLGVHLHALAFLDEQRHANLQSRLEPGQLGHSAACRVAADAGLSVGHCQLH